MQKFEKFWRNWTNFGYLLEKLDILKIMLVQILSSKKKLRSWNLIWGYPYIVSKDLWNRFWIFDFFGNCWLCPKFWIFCPKFWTYLKKDQNFKTMFHRFLDHIEVPLYQILASRLHFWRENPHQCDFERIKFLWKIAKIWSIMSKYLKFLHYWQ